MLDPRVSNVRRAAHYIHRLAVIVCQRLMIFSSALRQIFVVGILSLSIRVGLRVGCNLQSQRSSRAGRSEERRIL